MELITITISLKQRALLEARESMNTKGNTLIVQANFIKMAEYNFNWNINVIAIP